MEACCTCATLLTAGPYYSESEKPLPSDRRLDCCARVICGQCIHKNARFSSYCPYCQISSGPSTLPQGLKEPPSYASVIDVPHVDAPPPYTPDPVVVKRSSPNTNTNTHPSASDEKAALAASDEGSDEPPAEDTLHFLNHAHDSIASLSLRYGVPSSVLRQTNKLHSDHLLLARRTVLIPGTWYKGGVSLSPRPVEGEEEEIRKGKIRRWQVACKVADYDVAVLYLEQAGYDLAGAMEAYFADEAWEREHPLQDGGGGGGSIAKGKGKGVAPRSEAGVWNRASHAAFLRRGGPSNR